MSGGCGAGRAVRPVARALALGLCVLALAAPAAAADRLCDTAAEDCRAPLLQLIRNERVGIDVAFWFMEDARYTAALNRKVAEGVPVRVLVDTRANATYPLNAQRLEELRAGGVPMRRRTASGILHWKMMLFTGQNTVQFSAANYTDSFVPVVPYQSYIDEAVFFTDDEAVVNSFRTKFDGLWISETSYADHANVTRPLQRRYDVHPKDPEMNFPPAESYRSRAVSRYNAEGTAIDVIMYRITDRAHTDAMIRALARGVPVRLITEPHQYRDPTRYWHAWNVDRLYAAGAQIRHRAHQGLMHQKTVLLRGQRLSIFGSSNWTSPSSDSQEEHNYFTRKPEFFDWFDAQFARKWNNGTGHAETAPFVPLPPDAPAYRSPADGAVLPGTSAVLTWNGGLWAHVYDIYFGTTPDPPLLAADQPLGPSESASRNLSFTITGLTPGTTYYWRIVSKTMAGQARSGRVFRLTTEGAVPPPGQSGDIVLYASRGTAHGNWLAIADGAAAGGSRMTNPDAGLPKLSTALASPADYFELSFPAEAGRPYHLWIRGRADRDHYANDSVHVQFSGAVNASGVPVFRIGTTQSTAVCIESGDGAGLSGWGWEDNGWGGLGAHIYFATTGTQTIRVQRREDGISIDQIVLSPATYLTQAPGLTKQDTTILPESGDSTPPDPPDPPDAHPGERVLYPSSAIITGSGFSVLADASAAGGAALRSTDLGRPKVVTAAANPDTHAELTFTAEAGQAYRLWVRGRATGDYWGNDSVHLQFSGAVTAQGNAAYRIGTTDSAVVNLEDCSGCGVSGWGWQDNGYGRDVLGPLLYFESTGTQTLRIQNREDGLVIDQVVLSPVLYVEQPPGPTRNDSTILPEKRQE